MRVYSIIASLADILLFACGIFMAAKNNVVAAEVDKMPADKFSDLAHGLSKTGVTLNKEQIKVWVTANVALIAWLLIIFAVVLLMLVVCACVAVKMYRNRKNAEEAYEMRKQYAIRTGKQFREAAPGFSFLELWNYKGEQKATRSNNLRAMAGPASARPPPPPSAPAQRPQVQAASAAECPSS